MQKLNLPIDPYDKTTPTTPNLKRALKTTLILLGFLTFSYLTFHLFTQIIISNLTLEQEKKYLWTIFTYPDTTTLDTTKLTHSKKLNPKLQNYDIKIINLDQINAFATVWWKIYLTQELLNNLKYEEELIFILGHEINHIKNRDPLHMLFTNFPFKATLMLLWMDINLEVVNISDLTNTYIDRKIELKADQWWINLIKQLKLNLNCSTNFFNENSNLFEKYLWFASTHPSNEARKQNIQKNTKKSDKTKQQCTKMKYYEK